MRRALDEFAARASMSTNALGFLESVGMKRMLFPTVLVDVALLLAANRAQAGDRLGSGWDLAGWPVQSRSTS
jgi:hypothetical protein